MHIQLSAAGALRLSLFVGDSVDTWLYLNTCEVDRTTRTAAELLGSACTGALFALFHHFHPSLLALYHCMAVENQNTKRSNYSCRDGGINSGL